MKKIKRILVILLAVTVALGLNVAISAAQQPLATKESGAAKPEVKDRLVVKGKIAQMKSAGYYVKAEDPPDEFIIVNPNVKQLKNLMKKGKAVNIEGYTTISADRLFIEKINGKKYCGDSKSAVQ
jgi:hypothetical protein